MIGRDVARQRERAPQRDGPVELAVVVARRPRLIVERERRRLVEHDRRRRDVGAAFLVRVLERREVDERLEHRARLPPRGDGAVVLRLVVGAAADHRQDFAGARIDGDQRRLRPLTLALREDLVHAREPVADGILRDPLQVQVERRVDVDRAAYCLVSVLQLLADVVDEIRRFGVERARHDLQRLARRRGRQRPRVMKPLSAIACSTTLRRSSTRPGC